MITEISQSEKCAHFRDEIIGWSKFLKNGEVPISSAYYIQLYNNVLRGETFGDIKEWEA